MIESISIKNFKSVVDLKLDLGQFNVLIGENGCGKSNILEGIAFGPAASVNKLDREFFSNRGIRITDPKFMYSVFNEESNPVIEIDIKDTKSGIFDKRFELKYNAELKPANIIYFNNSFLFSMFPPTKKANHPVYYTEVISQIAVSI